MDGRNEDAMSCDVPCETKRATSVSITVTKDEEKGHRDEGGTKAHSCCDKTHDIDGSDVRDAGPAEQAEETEERECTTNE